MPNRLINETSPYLLQHAHNPVDWHPWGEEALARARSEDKPIFLSIGYSACHWCHVMERESFENPDIAALMNANFISVKVDREERPDIDSIYMGAVQAMTGRGGWPLSMFLTPDGEPFYGGTYFPPEDRHGMPGFPRVLAAISDSYRQRRGDVARSATEITAAMSGIGQAVADYTPLSRDTLTQAYVGLRSSFDQQDGGFGTAPKFPQPMVLDYLLRHHAATGDAHALEMVELTLRRMAHGGMYDQLGGGFHRYSTDPFWLVPHFEKMLYDNALLSRLYLRAYQATASPLYARIAQETIDYVLREMTDPLGGFYSAQDADSEGEEGRYFVWTPGEIDRVLGREDGAILQAHFGVTHEGNFDGRSILHLATDRDDAAGETGTAASESDSVIARGKRLLLESRGRRVPPETDTKVLTAWNGLMLHSVALGAAVLHRPDYLRAAVAGATFILANMKRDGRLLRTYRDGQARLNAYLEDYALLADGLIALYEATFDRQWLDEANHLARRMLELFWDEGGARFYDTGTDHETLILRPRDITDNAMPSGGSAAADVLLRLSVLTGEPGYARTAAAALRSVQAYMARMPEGFGNWLGVLDFHLSSPHEIAVVGPLDGEDTQSLLSAVHSRYLPNRVLAGFDPANGVSYDDLPLLEDKVMQGNRPTAYVCHSYVCQQPVTDAGALAEQLAAPSGPGGTWDPGGLGPVTLLPG